MLPPLCHNVEIEKGKCAGGIQRVGVEHDIKVRVESFAELAPAHGKYLRTE